MLSQLDRFLLAFRRDLSLALAFHPDQAARLYWDDRTAFATAFHAAWATGRPEPFISLAKAAAMNEGLSVKAAGRLVIRLNQAGRWDEAVQVLHDPHFRLLETAAGQLGLTHAAFGLGRLREAAEAAGKARSLEPALAPALREIELQIVEMRTLQARARKTAAWAETGVLAERWLELGAPRPALQALTAFLTGDAPLETGDQEAFHFLLDTALSLEGPASAYSLFRAMERLPATAKVKADLQTICEGLHALRTGRRWKPPKNWRSSNGRLQLSGALAWGLAGGLEAGIEAIGALTIAYPRNAALRPELQRLVGRDLLDRRCLAFAEPAARRRVFDVFPFNNELRLLRLKLEEMSSWVDGFVLVEARQTFTGAPKPLVFQENKDKFAEFASKIIHVVVDAFPPYVRHAWAREHHQRDMGVVGLDGRASEDDLVIVSDTDEIAEREAVLGFDGQFAMLGMERLRYFMNYRQALPTEELKEYAAVWRARYIRDMGLSTLRDTLRFDKRAPRLKPAGWHFTSIGDAPGISYKMESTSHQEHAGVPVEVIDDMLSRIRAGVCEPGWERVELDGRFPARLRARRDVFEDVIL